ncbi:TPA: hypothetical protein O8U60_001357 [Enterobacter cloacae]|nr:hypothetical protein [Enterobacter cloacae]
MRVKRYEVNGTSSVFEDANGSLVDYEDYAALEAQLAALAAENAGLKAALRPSDIPSEWTDAFGDTAVIEHDSTGDNQGHSVSWSWVGNQEEVIKSVLLAVDKGIETPATDAFLAEVRASGIDQWIASRNGRWNGTTAEAERFAVQLRKGVQS